MALRKAQRAQSKLRIGISGPSGSGKTMGALMVARGLASSWDKIAIIDTENGSADLYSHLGDYLVLTLNPDYSPERYIQAIKDCENAGVEVIIIDSVTHEWDGQGGCLEINDNIAKTKFQGNTWSAWSITTPRHQKFLAAITSSACHIITTARSKTDTIQVNDGNKTKIKKVGLKDVQREGFEYELTIAFNVDRDGHYAIASKDRTSLFSERDPFLLSEEIGKEIAKWNASGVDTEKLKAELFDRLAQDINSCQTISDLVAAFNESKSHAEYLGVVLKQKLIELKDMKKHELSKEQEHHEEPEEEPGAGDIADMEEANS